MKLKYPTGSLQKLADEIEIPGRLLAEIGG